MGNAAFVFAGVLLLVGMTYVATLFTPDPHAPVFKAASSSSTTAGDASSSAGLVPGSFAAALDGHLIKMENGEAQDFAASNLKDVKFWAIYYSASWCPPCRAFTPELVSFYNDFKRSHPNFELIFFNEDQSESDMLAYMNNDGMAWPAIRFSDRHNIESVLGRYAGRGIPDLVLLDAEGRVLSNSFDGYSYLGPQKVVEDIKTMVPTP